MTRRKKKKKIESKPIYEEYKNKESQEIEDFLNEARENGASQYSIDRLSRIISDPEYRKACGGYRNRYHRAIGNLMSFLKRALK